MFNLQKYEKIIITILIITLLVGLSITVYKKSRSNIKVDVSKPSVSIKDEPARVENPPQDRININTAGVDELMKIQGIGKVLAERIVEYRSQRSIFAFTEDIKNVKGIGTALFEKIKDKIFVD